MNDKNMELFEQLSRLQWLMHKHHLRAHAENGPMADPTRGQGRLFAILKMQDGISTKDLSYLLSIRVSSLNELLAKMEKSGYITREPSPSDKRVMLVKLTEKGRNEEQQEWRPTAFFSCLSEEEQTEFSGYLGRIIAAVEEELGEEADQDARDWWTRGGRERMGEEMFARFASMRHGMPAPDGREQSFDSEHSFGGFPHGGEHPFGGMHGFGIEPEQAPKDPHNPKED